MPPGGLELVGVFETHDVETPLLTRWDVLMRVCA
jgi:hypothetical protein